MSRRAATKPRTEKSEQSGFHPRRVSHRTEGQKEYIKKVLSSEITFATGPAGCGKTHIAIGTAVSLFRDRQVERIILSRPAVDSGSSLGYLPGTMEEKMHPYLAPLYDELAYYIETKSLKAWMEHGLIEIVPLSLMRGRTFNNAFVILDEAQNALMSELRMCLTRIGLNSKMVITGDLSQSDLNNVDQGGLQRCVNRLDRIPGISVVSLTADDIVRHPLISKIENALAGRTPNAALRQTSNDCETSD